MTMVMAMGDMNAGCIDIVMCVYVIQNDGTWSICICFCCCCFFVSIDTMARFISSTNANPFFSFRSI